MSHRHIDVPTACLHVMTASTEIPQASPRNSGASLLTRAFWHPRDSTPLLRVSSRAPKEQPKTHAFSYIQKTVRKNPVGKPGLKTGKSTVTVKNTSWGKGRTGQNKNQKPSGRKRKISASRSGYAFVLAATMAHLGHHSG